MYQEPECKQLQPMSVDDTYIFHIKMVMAKKIVTVINSEIYLHKGQLIVK